MRVVKRSGLVLLAVCGFSGVAVSSASAAPLFLSHPLGLLLLISAVNTQTFMFFPKGSIACTGVKLLPPGNITTALRSLSLLLVIDYESCKVFGLAGVVNPAWYRYDANGLITLLNTVLALAEQECVITLPANQAWTGANFFDFGDGIGAIYSMKSVTSEGKGGPGKSCEHARESGGSFGGRANIIQDGGLLRLGS